MSFARQKLRNQALKLFKHIENCDNADPARNGELNFLRSFLSARTARDHVVVLDCGANRGDWTASCMEQAGDRPVSFHLFDPSRACCEVLVSRFNAYPNIRVNQVGVSDVQEDRLLFSDTDGSSLSSLYRRRISEAVVLKKEETVRVVRLDGYLDQLGIRHVDLIKLDVEGHELQALRGLGKHLDPGFIDAIQFEYGGANVDSGTRLADLYALLGDAGFEICKVMPRHIEPRSWMPFMENFMYANYVALATTAGL